MSLLVPNIPPPILWPLRFSSPPHHDSQVQTTVGLLASMRTQGEHRACGTKDEDLENVAATRVRCRSSAVSPTQDPLSTKNPLVRSKLNPVQAQHLQLQGRDPLLCMSTSQR